MRVYFRDLGQRLVDACRSAEAGEMVLLVAPFIKRGALDELLSHLPRNQKIRIVTRWHLDEIAAGASDAEVWELIEERPRASLWLCANLHAKYYRIGDVCYSGSANLTDAALCWGTQSNFEMLLEAPFDSADFVAFEKILTQNCIEVSQDLFEHFRQLLDEFQLTSETIPVVGSELYSEITSVRVSEPENGYGSETSEHSNYSLWTPHLRQPSSLYDSYQGNEEALTSTSFHDGKRDLQFLALAPGLSEEAFNLQVSWRLLQAPIIRQVDEFVSTSRRFGAVRDYLEILPCSEASDFDASETWQTLMRWLLYFLGDRYRRHVANYSEIFEKRH